MVGSDRVSLRLGLVTVARNERDIGARRSQCARDRRAQALGTTGDERGAPVQAKVLEGPAYECTSS